MYLLYERFIEQIKKQDIKRYNEKHRDYLVRSGKIKQQENKMNNSNISHQAAQSKVQSRRSTTNYQSMNQFKKQSSVPTYVDQRPLKGNNSYVIDNNMAYENNFQKRNARFQTEKQRIIQKPKIQQREKIREISIKNTQMKNAKSETRQVQKPIKINSMPVEAQEQYQQIQLIKCPLDCGRKFKPQALEKHVKVCQKVEKKRQVFKVKVVDEEAEDMKRQDVKVKEKPKVAKWMKQSAQLRKAAVMAKQNNGQNAISSIVIEDDRLQCGGCGRKFNEQAAKKHIPNCIKRNKMKK